MHKVIHCECGEAIRATSNEELIAAVKVHVAREHPQLLEKLSDQDILAMAEEDD